MFDVLNERIIRELSKDSRISFRELAKKLGVSTSTVIQRVRGLERMGVIEGYSVSFNYEKLGYELTAVIEVFARKGKLVAAEEEIAKLPHVVAVYDVTGECDAVVVAKFKNREQLNKFVKHLLSLKNVERTNTHFVLNVVKEDFSHIV
ncbi:MAG: Lrp/AsnC family transcriptional regulator [Candidatus Micrarchaeia archaeon]